MELWDLGKVPQELLELNEYETKLNIVIGENGCGKSSLLKTLASFYLEGDRKVIAIANTIHDKFDIRHPNFKALKASTGKSLVNRTILQVLAEMNDEGPSKLSFVTQILEYVNYDSRIGFRFKGLNKNYSYKIEQAENLTAAQKDEFMFLINRTFSTLLRTDIIWLSMNKHSFQEIFNSDFLRIFKYEKILRKLKIVSALEIFLSKNGKAIPLLNASSGELTLISSILYVAIMIKTRSIILIDEPENSLHPKWQVDYVKNLDRIFYFFNPQIVIATHSPLILNGAELELNSKIFKSESGQFIAQQNEPLGMEEVYYNFFNITTPENRFISEELTNILNEFAEKKLTLAQLSDTINEMKSGAYEEKQIEVLDSILELAKQIK